MNINGAALRLLSNFSPEERSIPDNSIYPGRNHAVLTAMNSGLQDLFAKGKPWVRSDERGEVIHAPVTVPIQVTNGSRSAVIDAGDWLGRFAGATCVIEGSNVDNQIRNNTASDIILKYPHDGTTGTKNALIYQDVITFDADVLEVIEPFRLDRRDLVPMPNPFAFGPVSSTEDFGFRSNSAQPIVGRVAATAGTPRGFCVETWSKSGTDAPRVRARLYPAPLADGFIDYKVMLLPPVITDIASTDELPIPFQFVESIFLPIATKHLRGCAFWRATMNDQQVEDSYQNAMLLLAEGNPKRRSGIRLRPKY